MLALDTFTQKYLEGLTFEVRIILNLLHLTRIRQMDTGS